MKENKEIQIELTRQENTHGPSNFGLIPQNAEPVPSGKKEIKTVPNKSGPSASYFIPQNG